MCLLVHILIITLGQYMFWLTVTVLKFHWHGTQMIQWPSSQITHGIIMIFKTNHSVFNSKGEVAAWSKQSSQAGVKIFQQEQVVGGYEEGRDWFEEGVLCVREINRNILIK